MVRTPQSHCLGPRVQSLVGELRSHKPCGAAKNKQTNNKRNTKVKYIEGECVNGGRGHCSQGEGGVAILNGMIRVGIPEKVTFEQRSEGFKDVGQEDIWRKECSRWREWHVQRSCGRERAWPVPGTVRVPARMEKMRRQEYRMGAEQ